MKKDQLVTLLGDLVKQYHSTKDLSIRIEIAQKHINLLNNNVYLLEDDISNGIPQHEVWKNIVGYEGTYQISNYGNIKALERFFIKSTEKYNNFKQAVYQPLKIRDWAWNASGYVLAHLWLMGKSKTVAMHRLVAMHFLENPNNYPQVLHNDDNPKNPRWDNLEWGTQKKNIQDCVDRGRWHIGGKNNMAKLKEYEIPIIRKLIKQGIPSRKIGKMFNVAKSQILSIKHKKTWKHIKEEDEA